MTLTKLPSVVLVGLLALLLYGTYELTRQKVKIQPKQETAVVVKAPEPPKIEVKEEPKVEVPVVVETPKVEVKEESKVETPVVVPAPVHETSKTPQSTKAVETSQHKKKITHKKHSPSKPKASQTPQKKPEKNFFDELFDFD